MSAAGAGLAALMGYTVGGALGAVTGAMLTEPAIRAAAHARDEIGQARRMSGAALVAIAAHEKQTDPDDLIAEALSTREGTQLLAEALDAAMHTLDERKVAALAKAVANGLFRDAARVDAERLVVRALAELEAPHIKLLGRLPAHSRGRPALREPRTARWRVLARACSAACPGAKRVD